MNFENLKLERKADLVIVTVCRPEALNALNSATLRELGECFEALAAPAAEPTRAALLTGEGKAFVAGADIAEMLDFGPEAARRFSALGHRVFSSLGALPFPVIAAVNGFALGGGFELALACDFILASEKARFGQPEVKLGVIPGFNGSGRLSRRVGLARAKELIFSGRMVRADEALQLGIANHVYPADQLMEEAQTLAKAIAAMGPLAVAQAKRVLTCGAEVSLEAAGSLEQQAFGLLFGTEDRREGMQSFLEKREAVFKAS